MKGVEAPLETIFKCLRQAVKYMWVVVGGAVTPFIVKI